MDGKDDARTFQSPDVVVVPQSKARPVPIFIDSYGMTIHYPSYQSGRDSVGTTCLGNHGAEKATEPANQLIISGCAEYRDAMSGVAARPGWVSVAACGHLSHVPRVREDEWSAISRNEMIGDNDKMPIAKAPDTELCLNEADHSGVTVSHLPSSAGVLPHRIGAPAENRQVQVPRDVLVRGSILPCRQSPWADKVTAVARHEAS